MQKKDEMWPDNKKLGKETLQKYLILLVGAGAITVTAYSPLGAVALARMVLRILGQKIDKKLIERYSEDSIRKSLHRLKKNKYIKQANIKEGDKIKIEIKLTKKGKKLFQGYTFYNLNIKPIKKWDGKWRFVIYDIPESAINTRNIFRDKLKKMKFFMVQKSVWAHPHPCKKEIDFIAEFLGIQENVLVFETKIENDKRLINHFRAKGLKT